MNQPAPSRHATSLFQDRFSSRPSVLASAPGRINLLGEHTDYNGGPVLPFAIQRRTVVAAAPAGGGQVVSAHDGRVLSIDPRGPRPADWTRYPWGVLRVLSASGVIVHGGRLAVASTVPVGAGLSSSAALCLSIAKAIVSLSGRRMTAADLAEVAWRAEHDEVGVHCGRMDQTIGALATPGSALLIETASGRVERVPFRETAWVLETGVVHELETSAYHQRRRECAEALAFCRDHGFRIGGLADLASSDLPAVGRLLPPPLVARIRHVVTETGRTRDAAHALGRGDLGELGRLMVAGHISLRDDYDSSCPEADLLVDGVVRRGALGARLTGAGWGGAVIALLPRGRESRILAEASEEFRRATGKVLVGWSTRAGGGVKRERIVSAS
jgi:galactokinase